MKRVCTILLVVVCIIINAFSQVPEKMSYQAVVRNSSDELVKNSMVGMKISILQGSITGTPIYVETQAVSTNANGLLTVEIGDGIPITGTFSDIDWSKGPYYLKTETDPTGGTTYTISGVSQLISVPYALHAKTADNITGTIYETDPVFGTSPAAAITVTDTANWNNKLDTEADGSVTNEIQTLGLNGDQLSISGTGGNTITFTNWDTNWSNDVLVIGDQTIAGNKTFTGTINANSNTVINVADPVNNKDAANKAYVDQLIARIEALEETINNYFTFLDARDNHEYRWVRIGNQDWMAENLAYLPSVSPSSGSFGSPYYYVYGYEGTNVDEAKATSNYTTYGVLYSWTAAMAGATSSDSNPSGVQGVCPSSWHLPSDAEWTQLTDYLGGEGIAGGKLKEAGYAHWESPNTAATNESGFTALPGGYYYDYTGAFSDLGIFGGWWSSTENPQPSHPTYSFLRTMYYNSGGVSLDLGKGHKINGFSVRCVKD